MDEPIGNTSSQATVGNGAIPEWMLKRRARQQAQASAAVAGSELEIVSGVMPVQATEVELALDAPPSFDLPPVSVRGFERATNGFKQNARLAKNAPVDPLIKVVAAPLVEVPWYEAFRQRWLTRDALGGFAVSLGTHLALGLLLSVVVLHQQSTGSGSGADTMLIVGGDEGGSGEKIDGSSVLELPPATGTPEQSLDTVLSANAVSAALGPSQISTPGELGSMRMGSGGGDGNGEGNGEGDGIGDGLNVGGFKMPEGGKVARKGSFTAWTVPEDPAPGEDYKIIIQVQYKNKNQKITPDDITGSVIGTDKYRLMISRHTSEIIPEASQVVVYVPGASARIRDTIRVYSATLRENQRLEIVF